jgi:dTDP-4-amino-4,6-dideoxygalactose transaminase
MTDKITNKSDESAVKDDVIECMNNQQSAKSALSKLSNKNHIHFFDSGDDAIMFILKHLRESGHNRILVPDMGGWFSYKKFPARLGMDIYEIKTSDALIDIFDLKNNIKRGSIVLINSMGGYFVSEPMDVIEKICSDIGAILINDISASIGTENAMYGDYCIGSFGEYKPLEVGIGGFIGTKDILDTKETSESTFDNEQNIKKLYTEISGLNRKLAFWNTIRKTILDDLQEFSIIHSNSSGINVVVAFETDEDLEKLINYCLKHDYQYKVCPNYIKVNRKAVSIEVKRIRQKIES